MATPLETSVLSDRRWLIGIGVSISFGLFGVVMAILSYADRDKTAGPGAAPAVTAAPTAPPAPRGNGNGNGKGRGRD